MRETQDSISEWATETFGAAGSNARVAARANEELAELLRAITSGNDDKVPEEAADVAIVLCRVAQRLGDPHQDVIVDALNNRPLKPSALFFASRANVAMAELLNVLAIYDDDPPMHRVERLPHSLIGNLKSVCLKLHTTLEEQIDRKMEINRARVWKRDGTGHGYHVREKG